MPQDWLQDSWPLVLLGLRIAVAVALYLFLLTAVRALRAEVRARTMPVRAVTARRTAPSPTAAAPVLAPAGSRAPSAPPAPPIEAARRPAGDRLEVIAYEGEAPDAAAFTGRSFALDGPALIGRGAGNTIVLPERHVSSRHARLIPDEDGWWVEDLGSTNGTYVGPHRVAGRARLGPSDEVRFGPVVARLVRHRR